MFFRRKEKEIEESELQDSLPVKKRPVFREPRELPPKPWGKKERILILLAFVSTALISGILALSSRGFKLPTLPRISLPSVSFQETYTITKEK